MANPDRPQGLRPHGEVKQAVRMVAGAAVYPGDAVQLQSDGKVDPVAAGGDVLGVALEYASADGASVLVSVDPNQQYIVQADGADVDAQTDIGNLVDLLATAGDSTYKTSRMELDSSTIGTGSGGQLAILGVSGRVGNALGAQVDVLVKINEHQAFGETDFAGV